jgi:hypothetical protein
MRGAISRDKTAVAFQVAAAFDLQTHHRAEFVSDPSKQEGTEEERIALVLEGESLAGVVACLVEEAFAHHRAEFVSDPSKQGTCAPNRHILRISLELLHMSLIHSEPRQDNSTINKRNQVPVEYFTHR